ncbi:uroporphyrinogen-III synthase [Halalkalibacter akibai JCM 9157]|uniref:Uroporphyrinogen-III synthase n=1 Tax=Halalkalibacter akibai (strain ATCC 43226 / DSM 21942 / CIP 109018 / JCM 9157 / 1139) TaxID=1236973 RepID=W4QZY7_HALA3|nr:uroporphyrinogen-III synthase [Halalkalibacter akibai JCM 9157]
MSLHNKRVVLAASRKTDEMSILIEKQKGTPLVRSLQGTVFSNDEQVKKNIREMAEQEIDWFIFTTGIGLNKLLDLAEEINEKESFIDKVKNANVGARGYKTVAALKKIGIVPDVKDDDGTVNGLIDSLKEIDWKDKRVIVQLHGENAPTLINYLTEAGAKVMEVLPYQHVDPNPETVELFFQELVNQEMDAVCFTAAIQVRSLFKYAESKGYTEQIIEAFRKNILAVAVGKVTAEALHEHGIERVIQPELERMGAMIVELSRYYEKNEGNR